MKFTTLIIAAGLLAFCNTCPTGTPGTGQGAGRGRGRR